MTDLNDRSSYARECATSAVTRMRKEAIPDASSKVILKCIGIITTEIMRFYHEIDD